MSQWWNGSATLFDLESDGRDPAEARIITACVAEIRPNVPPLAQTWLVKPERDIPQEAIDVHGITTEHAAEFGEDRTCIEAVALALSCAGPDEPVVMHNARYDLTLTDRELRRLGIGSLGTDGDQVAVRIDGRQVGAFHVIDSMVLDKAVDRYRRGSRKLTDVAEHYGVPIRGDAHTAEADALAAGRIVWAIAKRCAMPISAVADFYMDRRDPYEVAGRFYDLGAMTLPELHRAQVGWAWEQADGLAAHFARTGKADPDGVCRDWPLQPVKPREGITA